MIKGPSTIWDVGCILFPFLFELACEWASLVPGGLGRSLLAMKMNLLVCIQILWDRDVIYLVI